MSSTVPSTSGLADTQTAILSFLTSKHVPPTGQWLDSVLSTLKLNAPILGLQKTVLFRMLASDITTSVQSTTQSILPSDVSNPNTAQLLIRGPILVQILDIEDIGRSRWSQVEAIEMEDRGETTRGREIIRAVPTDEDEMQGTRSTPAVKTLSDGPHKLLLQDASGRTAYAMELENLREINVASSIGTKLILRNVNVARGTLLLTPSNVEILGGKIDAWDKKWRDDRKGVLKGRAGWTENLG
jgi:RecQ-mediated genome instability protein 1